MDGNTTGQGEIKGVFCNFKWNGQVRTHFKGNIWGKTKINKKRRNYVDN